MLTLMLGSVFLAVKYASLGMKVTSAAKPYPSGSIICTASVAGLRSNAGSTDYSASKAAVVSSPDVCVSVGWYRHPRECYLPGSDRDGDDAAGV